MDTSVKPIHPEFVMDLWPDIEKHLHSANVFNDGRVPLYHWLARILSGNADLFIASDMGSAMVCEVVQYPTKQVYLVVLFGGDPDHLEMQKDAAVKAARLRGCAELEVRGRSGWKRRMKEWGAELLHCHWKLDI